MAGQKYQSPAFMVAACLLVLAAASPLALVQGQPILGSLGALNLTSAVCCTPSGNCSPGAAGLANVTGILKCVNPLTGVLAQVGNGTSTANGTLTISVAPLNLVGSLLSGVVGRVVPCILIDTLSLVNQAVCPVLNVTNTVLTAVPTTVAIVPNLLTGVITALLSVKNLTTINATVAANIGI